jgi:phosphate-selective porin
MVLIPAALLAQIPAEDEPAAQDDAIRDSGHFLQFRFKNRPSLRIGEFANVDLKSKWHFDYEQFYPPVWNPPGTSIGVVPQTQHFILSRARLGLKGDVTHFISYEIEREMRRTFGGEREPEAHVWKDVNMNFSARRSVQVQIGKFKLPFGMEENTSTDHLDFINRSRVTDVLAPARQQGLMLHGKLLKNDRLNYAFGVFRHDGENSQAHDAPTGGTTYGARLNGTPLRSLKQLPKTLRNIYLGIAATSGRLYEGQGGLQGSTAANFTFLNRMFVYGRRQRLGTELSWAEGPVSVKGEYIHASDERKGQGLSNEDLPDEISRGWYVTGIWTALGKMKKEGVPKDPLLTGHGFGAVEFAARFDVLSFYSAPGGPAGRSPRSPTILPNSDREWTFGATWYINHFVKLQANGQREWLTDIGQKAMMGRNRYWTGLVRLQLAI